MYTTTNANTTKVCLTKLYMEKVNGTKDDDNCKLEFQYAARVKTKRNMIAVVLDPYCKDTSKWTGTVGFILGGELYVDFSDDNNFDNKINNLLDEINKR